MWERRSHTRVSMRIEVGLEMRTSLEVPDIRSILRMWCLWLRLRGKDLDCGNHRCSGVTKRVGDGLGHADSETRVQFLDFIVSGGWYIMVGV